MASGNQVSAANLTGQVSSVAHCTLDAWVQSSVHTVAIVGDSITDGRGSDTDKNNRWPDLLLTRLQFSGDSVLTSLALANQTAGGNRGPTALGRFGRDMELSQPGKDIGDQVIAALKQIVTRAYILRRDDHTVQCARAQPVHPTVLEPYTRGDAPAREFIRHGGFRDTVADFDVVVRNPSAPSQSKDEFN
ncbi:hypothetical protein C8Q74DRAFT_1370731 [Fomes fomentarius]|nr:hypothetical protein C8Q74DRAFT_1370731 [Fomes fomentarius]